MKIFDKKKWGKEYYKKGKEKMDKYRKEWSERNPEKIKSYKKKSRQKRLENGKELAYTRRARLGTYKNGKRILFYGIQKRDFPKDNLCELCQEKPIRKSKLAYHHWDDDDFKKGLWICWECHMIVTVKERNKDIDKIFVKYLKIKQYGKS